MIKTFNIDTSMGKIISGQLPFLTKQEQKNLNEIGYTGKLNGVKITREIYLNSLGKGEFTVNQTKFDMGDFCQSFNIIQVI